MNLPSLCAGFSLNDADWGSVPAYFGGLALLLTVYTLVRDRSERRRKQASQVAAWAESRVSEDGRRYYITMRNASDLPVTDVRLVVASEKTLVRLRIRKDRVPEGPLKHHFTYIPTFPPDATQEVGGFDKPTPIAVQSLEFSDSSGRRWLRSHGRLRDISYHRAYRRLRSKWTTVTWRRL